MGRGGIGGNGCRPNGEVYHRASHLADRLCNETRTPRNLLDLNQHTAFGPQLIIERTDHFKRLVAIRSNNRMDHFGKKSEEAIGRTVDQIEALVFKYPVIFPVMIVPAMLPYIAGGILVATIGRGHRLEIPEPLEELYIFERAHPGNIIDLEAIDYVTSDTAGHKRDLGIGL